MRYMKCLVTALRNVSVTSNLTYHHRRVAVAYGISFDVTPRENAHHAVVLSINVEEERPVRVLSKALP